MSPSQLHTLQFSTSSTEDSTVISVSLDQRDLDEIKLQTSLATPISICFTPFFVLSPSLPPSLPPSLLPSFPPFLPPFLLPSPSLLSLPPSLPPSSSLPPSLPPSLRGGGESSYCGRARRTGRVGGPGGHEALISLLHQ